MEIRQIMYILTLADEGNMTRAAEKLNITQPALSQTLHQIQEEVGLQLFRKNGRSLELTDDGRFFYQKGNELVEKAEEFYYLLDRRKNQNQTHLRYYTDVVDNADETMLMFQQFFPKISFERSYCSSWQAVRKLKSGELDLMLTLRGIEDPDHDLTSEELIDEPVYVLVNRSFQYAEDKVIPIAMLDGENLMVYQNSGSLVALFQEFFRLAGAHIGNIREVYDPFIQIQRNGGFIFIPESTYNSFSKTGKLGDCVGLKVRDSFCRRRVYLTYRESSDKDNLPHSFFSFLHAYHAISTEDHCLPSANRFTVKEGYILQAR